MNWFECKIKYEKTLDEGNISKVTEAYLVDALSFTEAEARIIEEIKPYISGEFEVANIRKVRITEIFPNPNGDRWYKAKVMYITVDEEKGVEKRTANFMYVQARDFKDALTGLTEGMGNTLVDYDIASITETALMDVLPYQPEAATRQPADTEPAQPAQ